MKQNSVQKHQLQQLQNKQQKIKVATLAGAIALLIAQATSSYASDIEIYTKPSETSTSGVVVMMLDTSGSMNVSEGGISACDLPEGLSNNRTIRNSSLTENGYIKKYCYFDSGSNINIYYHYKTAGGKWYSCVKGSVNYSNSCFVEQKKQPDIAGYTPIISGGTTYYYKVAVKNNTKYYDRMSRLKDALYTLATTPPYNEETEAGKKGIKKDVKIGIGLFPLCRYRYRY